MIVLRVRFRVNLFQKIKQVLSTKIGQANYMIAIIGEHSNDEHSDSEEIGYKNWQAYELIKTMRKAMV